MSVEARRSASTPPPGRTAVVLAGGGARAAYEAGALSALATMLPPGPRARASIGMFCGMSMGALNATWLAANAWDPLWNAEQLLHIWHDFSLAAGARSAGDSRRGFLRGLGRGLRVQPWSLLEPGPLERQLEKVPWVKLHGAIQHGRVGALLIPCHRLDTAETVVFAELERSVRPRAGISTIRKVRIGPSQLLASAALPTLLPARKLEDGTYCDGAFRFGTPLAPPLWCGANRLVVVNTASATRTPTPVSHEVAAGPTYVLGKLLDAAMLDPLTRDLDRLQDINGMLEGAAGARSGKHVHVDALVLQPSTDLGVVASEVAAELKHKSRVSRIWSYLADLNRPWEADLYSYLLMDEAYTRALTSLGRHDTFARQDEISAFFEHGAAAGRPAADARASSTPGDSNES